MSEMPACRQLQTSRGIVEFCDAGQGLPILYFHGTGAGCDSVFVLEQWLLDDGFRVIAPNRPGYYGTPLASGRSASDCADLAAELVRGLHVERVAVIGTSGGGLAACAYASRHPAQTACLVLQCALAHPLTTAGSMPAHLRRLHWMFRHHRICLPLLRFGFRREMRKHRRSRGSIIEYICGVRGPEVRNEATMTRFAELLVESERRCAIQPAGIENDWANASGPHWLSPDSVSAPTLILHDQADPLVPPVHVDWVRRCVPHAVHCDLHAGGHMIWVGRDAPRMRQVRREFIQDSFRSAECVSEEQ